MNVISTRQRHDVQARARKNQSSQRPKENELTIPRRACKCALMFDPQTKFFPHERLEAYRLARAAVPFVAARRAKLRGLPGQAGPQLERAVVGAQTNLCAAAANEGAAARRLFRIAISEPSEAGGAIDLALDFGAFKK
jgi:hypothetical protein